MTHRAGQVHARPTSAPSPNRAYLVHVLTILDCGEVVVITAQTTVPWLRQTSPAWVIPPGAVTTLGYVDVSDPWAYRHAETAARACGYRLLGEWTTRGRRPARQVSPPRFKTSRHRAGQRRSAERN